MASSRNVRAEGKVPESLLKLLRCPVTGLPLRQKGNELVTKGSTPEGKFVRYSIDDGIPILLPPS